MTRLSVTCFLLALLSGCTSDSFNTSGSFKSLADEVFVYENNEIFEKVDAVEVLKITDEDVTPLLGRLNQLRVLSDGSVLAFDVATVRIQHFDKTGNYLSSFGSTGDGPGDFSNEVVIQVHKDEIYVFERLGYKIEKFTFRGSQWVHSESITLGNIDDDLPWSFFKIDDDFIWMQYRHTRQNEKGASVSVHHVTTLDRSDPTVAETWLATLPEIDLMFEDLGGFIASYPVPYTPRPVINITSKNDIILARTDEFSFLRTPPGNLNPILLTTMPVERIRLTPEEKVNFTGYSESLHKMVRENMPEYRPAVIGRIVPDDQNGFWAGYQITDQSKNRWLYVDEHGDIKSETYLPNTFTPHVYFEEVFYGFEPDVDGLNAIKAYQIHSN